MFDGQSLLLTPSGGDLAPHQFRDGAHPDAKLTVASVPDTTFSERIATASWRVDHVPRQYATTILVTDGGTSDFYDDLTAEEVLDDLTSYIAARRAAGFDTVHALTATPAANFTGTQESRRQAYNAALVSDPSAVGADSVIDVASIPELTDPDDGTYFADAIGHYTQAAADLIADALIEAGI